MHVRVMCQPLYHVSDCRSLTVDVWISRDLHYVTDVSVSVDVLFELLTYFVVQVAGLQHFVVLEGAGVNGLFQNGTDDVEVVSQDVLW